ncbi:MAG: hypothetical protein IJ679_03070 [Lachnospiraceae bacterium]|nr:hypothetical protein [Lachnospiraceae bacterium]
MAGRLTKRVSHAGLPKIRNQERKFLISIEDKLDNGFEFKDADQADIKELHRFIAETVYKGLTITEVDKLYLRKRGLGKSMQMNRDGKEIIHYGKPRSKFRLFGYYNEKTYFVICRIDGKHKTHED